MAQYDPVKPEHLLTAEEAEPLVPKKYLGGGFTTPRDLSLEVLADSTPEVHRKLLFLKQRGEESGGGTDGFFGSMRELIVEKMGRHIDQIIAAACLYPDREATFDLITVSSVFMEKHGTNEPDLLLVRMVLGEMGMNALMNVEENEASVRAGQFFHYV